MPKLTPIKDIHWAGKQLRRDVYFGQKSRIGTKWLPQNEILPHHFLEYREWPVEMLLVLLREGAWLSGEDWRPYARYAMAKRLKARRDIIFRGDYEQYREILMDYQLNGGKISVRDELRKIARRLTNSQTSSAYDRMLSKFITSITNPHEDDAAIQPFHWMRTCLAVSQKEPIVGMVLMGAETQLQKEALCDMLLAK